MTVTIRRPLVTLWLPVTMDVAGAVLEFVARHYPNATLENGADGDTAVLTVMVTEFVDDNDPRLIHAVAPGLADDEAAAAYAAGVYDPAMSDTPTDPDAAEPVDPDVPADPDDTDDDA